MDDTDAEKREEIREQKREELLERLGEEGADGTADAGGDDADGPAAPAEPIHVEGPDHLQEVVGDHGVVLVDFYADWCGPCQMMEPAVQAVASDTAAAVAKVDIDRHQGLAQQHGVRGVPTLVLYADGQQAEQLVGVQDQATLTSLVEQYAT